MSQKKFYLIVDGRDDPMIGNVTVDRLPDWVCNGDPVIQRGARTFIQSLTQTEPRWRQLWRRLKAKIKHASK